MTTRKRPKPKTYPPLTQSTSYNYLSTPIRRRLKTHAHIAHGHVKSLQNQLLLFHQLLDHLEPDEIGRAHV